MTARRTAIVLLAAGLAVAVATTPAGAQPAAAPPVADSRSAPALEPAAAAPVASSRFAPRRSLRGPVTDENFYFVMADRFENGSTANDTGGISGNRMEHGFDPTSK